METCRPDVVNDAVRQWRAGFSVFDGIRPDDVDELCDHFRSAVESRMFGGATLEVAIAGARAQLGEPASLTLEMGKAQRPPSFFRRWTSGLALYAVGQTAFICARVAFLTVVARSAGTELPVEASGYSEASLFQVFLGLVLIVVVSTRFGLTSRGRNRIRSGSLAASVGLVVLLGITLLFGLLLTDLWQWWLSPASSAAGAWDSVPAVLTVGAAGPVVALLVAISVNRWHPGLREVERAS